MNGIKELIATRNKAYSDYCVACREYGKSLDTDRRASTKKTWKLAEKLLKEIRDKRLNG